MKQHQLITAASWVFMLTFVGTGPKFWGQKACKASNTNHLTTVVLGALEKGRRVGAGDIASKLLSFGANGVMVFKGAMTSITKQLQMKHALFMIGIHCFAHRMNLALRSLSWNFIFQQSKKLIQRIYMFFNKSPKHLSEFHKLIDMIETKGLKPFQNVQTKWISLLEPLQRFLSEYKTLIIKLHTNQGNSRDS